jgi:hypothetical protein
VVVTNAVTELSVNDATLNGLMTECFGKIKEYGFYYGTDAETNQKIVVGQNEFVAKPFKATLADIKPGKYYYKAFATNYTGTGYGSVGEFRIRLAGDNSIFVYLDGKELTFDVQPIIDKGRTFVPQRTIFEALGADVQWDEKTQTVVARKGDLKVTLVIGGKASINGKLAPLDAPARIVNGRTLVPLRFISEAMNCKVDWIADVQTVMINSNPSPN